MITHKLTRQRAVDKRPTVWTKCPLPVSVCFTGCLSVVLVFELDQLGPPKRWLCVLSFQPFWPLSWPSFFCPCLCLVSALVSALLQTQRTHACILSPQTQTQCAQACVDAYTNACMYAPMHACAYVHVHTHTHTYTQLQMCTQTCIA